MAARAGGNSREFLKRDARVASVANLAGEPLRAARLILSLIAALAAPCTAFASPARIVSLDYCADQFVLALADRAQIAALSRGAARDDSYFRARAEGLPRIRADVESVMARRPDLIVRSWGGGAQAEAIYARLGVSVLKLDDAPNFAAARATLLRAAEAMGQAPRGRRLAADLDARLARLALQAPTRRPDVLYVTAGGAVAGRATMMDAVIAAAGGRNARAYEGWRVLPLEGLLTRPPAIVAQGFFDSGQTRATPWTFARHPALARALAPARRVALPADEVSCAAWYDIAAAERLAAAISSP